MIKLYNIRHIVDRSGNIKVVYKDGTVIRTIPKKNAVQYMNSIRYEDATPENALAKIPMKEIGKVSGEALMQFAPVSPNPIVNMLGMGAARFVGKGVGDTMDKLNVGDGNNIVDRTKNFIEGAKDFAKKPYYKDAYENNLEEKDYEQTMKKIYNLPNNVNRGGV